MKPARSHVRMIVLLMATVVVAACQRTPEATSAAPDTQPASPPASAQQELSDIAKEAYIYGYPMVDNYRVQYSYFVDAKSPEYKGPWNQIHNTARVFTPDDKTIQTPNSDTPYSALGADLRAEPLVISVPAVDKERYYSAQFIDLYTYNFAYVGSRATGSEAADYLLAGPDWKGDMPAGIKQVIQSETQLAFVLFRTQLFNEKDIEQVKKIQAGYKVQPLSAFLKTAPPPPAPAIDFIAPLTPEQQKSSPEFFRVLNFLLQFAPTVPSETELMARFAKIGVGAGKPFDVAQLSPDTKKAIGDGMAAAWKDFNDNKVANLDTGKESSADYFGTREHLQGNYLRRMSAAVLGIYGNSKDEALYPAYFIDANGAKLDGATGRYTLHFAADQFPPANAFWSVTLYELPSSLLSANPLNRYLINSPMLPGMKKDAEGGLTIYVQHESPGKDKEANWLPAPKGPFFLAMRLYWPKTEALEGRWKAPPLQPAAAP